MRFDVPAFALDRQIRACTPAPGAWANLHPHGDDANETLHVSKAIPADMTADESPRNLKPGELHVTKHHVWWHFHRPVGTAGCQGRGQARDGGSGVGPRRTSG